MLPVKQMTTALAVVGVCLLLISESQSKKLTHTDKDNCEVCVSFMEKFIDSLDSDAKSTPANVEVAFRKMCKKTKKDDNRFCYFIGGLEESATGILNEMSKPVSWGMPAEKICIKLYRKDEQICDLKYDKTYDFATLNLKKLKVKELKNILSDWNEKCKGCTEKQDYIKMIEDKMAKHEPEAWAKRQKEEL